MSASEGAPKIYVATPCRYTVHARYAMDLLNLVMASVQRGATIKVHIADQTSLVHQAREDLARFALEWGATHVLWIDSDVRFPSDALFRLLAHERPIVGANYATRDARTFTARRPDGHPLVTGSQSGGLEEAGALGFGFLLVEARVFREIPRPWFWRNVPEGATDLMGEDYWFCAKAEVAGFPRYVDHDLSREVKHVGRFELTCEHVTAS